MIKNERQYRITKAQARKFERALTRLSAAPNLESIPESPTDKAVHPLLAKAQRDALRSQLDDLQAEMRGYEALQSGQCPVLPLESFERLPRALIQARIAAGLTQKDLGAKLGLKEQQIQRYEATEYAAASLQCITKVVHALGITVRGDIHLPDTQI